MCGIVGIVDMLGNRQIDRDLLEKMRDSLVHRGPDESGAYYSEGIALGHRRLSIIDLKSGQQPMTDSTGNVTVTYNGEIYNFKEIGDELKKLGHVFRTDSDTEVVLLAWKEWKESCVEKFRGMFAFVIYDEFESTVFLARDRLGIKPLYYAVTQCGFFIFASELKALRLHPGFCSTLDGTSIVNYFTFGYVPQPNTIHTNSFKLSAGHTLSLVKGCLQTPRQYWDVAFRENTAKTDSVYKELVCRLKESIDLRMVSEVPLGAFLSGGVDSSSIVALMSEMMSEKLHTCSIGFATKSFDESSYSRKVARLLGTDHSERIIDGSDYSQVAELAAIYDEPYADSSALPTLSVCQLARENCTVALSGDGADELLVGYRRQRMHLQEERIRRLFPFALRSAAFGSLARVYPKADWAPRGLRAKTTLEALAQNSVQAYLGTVSMISKNQRNQLFSEDFKRNNRLDSAELLFEHYREEAKTDDPMLIMQYLDIKTYLVDDILTKVDRASMFHSLEVRVPFIDHELLDWLINLPKQEKLTGAIGKRALKKAMESRLPSDVLYRNKMGFSIPLKQWLRGPLAPMISDAIASERLRDSGIFNINYLVQLQKDHMNGKRDNSTILWVVLMFAEFLKSVQT